MKPTAVTPPALPVDQPGASSGVLIRVGSEKQALDWSLALASQQIACVIRALPDDAGWALEVDSPDAGRALRTLRLYHLENRRWREALHPKLGEFAFHWGALMWCLLMAMVYWAGEAVGGRLEEAGAFVTRLTGEGQIWRPLTATYLHSGADHLAANLTTGFLLLGLAMGRFGVGPALLLSLIAGVGGNLLAWIWRGQDYTGLGASGVVMGALGLLAVSVVVDVRGHRLAPGTAVRGLLGGVALFVLLGTSPQSDVLAHFGGFLCGAMLSVAMAVLPVRVRQTAGFDGACAFAYLALGLAGWVTALG